MKTPESNPNRRQFLKISLLAGGSLFIPWKGIVPKALAAPIAGGTLDPLSIPKYVTPLLIPPAMPLSKGSNKNKNNYNIAIRQFGQQILPNSLPPTKVWGYGSTDFPGTVPEGGTFNFPSFTIESRWNKRTEVKWSNELLDAAGNYLPHILPVDQTLHWANPPGGLAGRDKRGNNPAPYQGPVPMVTHVHGAHTLEDSDGYPEAWYLPAARNIPAGYAAAGTYFDIFNAQYGNDWTPGVAKFKYPNDQRATTLWYHDHTLGMTRVNVYAGPAGFYLIRGGPDDDVRDMVTDEPAVLPGPAPQVDDPPGTKYYEIPIVIQDRSFNGDGSLFYPDARAFFEGLSADQLQIPFTGTDPNKPSDVAPIWVPEFFANTMVVNGNTWPYLEVERRRYRFRLLNGCNSRFLILRLSDTSVPIHQIGAEGGFLPFPAPIKDNTPYPYHLLMAPAERADVIVDFGGLPEGTTVELLNVGPDEPFGGGTIGTDFDPADAATTGKVMQFRVVAATVNKDPSTPPDDLLLPAIAPLVPTNVRQVSLNEEESAKIYVPVNEEEEFALTRAGNLVAVGPNDSSTTRNDLDIPGTWTAAPFGPTSALLGTLDATGAPVPRLWMGPTTENPAVGATELWEIHNFTMDAHPIHIHLIQFQVVDRQAVAPDGTLGAARGPNPGETGFKDTVIAYPGEITRVRMKFDKKGLFVWHCHIVEHEDNEMMRPYRVV